MDFYRRLLCLWSPATRLQHFLARLDSNQQQNPAVVIIEISATGMVSLGSVLNVDVSRAAQSARAVKERQEHHGPVPPLHTAIRQKPASQLHINGQTQTHTDTHATAVRSMDVKEQRRLAFSEKFLHFYCSEVVLS